MADSVHSVDAGDGMDIVERLRGITYATPNEAWRFEGLIAEAAEEIERWRRQWDDEHELTQALDAEIERLRKFINDLDISVMHPSMDGGHQCSIGMNCRRLEPEQWEIVMESRRD